MANNKPFANLDKLSKRLLPSIPPFNPKINQGQPTPPINTEFADQLNLENRVNQPSLKTTTHLAQYFLSDQITNVDANTKFRKTISLANRLNQPEGGTTNHLAQFFLSDVFTGYIKVKTPTSIGVSPTNTAVIGKPSKTKTPQQQGSVDVNAVAFLPMQGGEEPVVYGTNIEAKQGILNFQGFLTSGIALFEPSTTKVKSKQQGIQIRGGQLSSFIIIQEPKKSFEQGSTDINPTKTSTSIQGGTNPTIAKNTEDVQTSQGISIKGSTLVSSLIPDQPVLRVDQGIINNGITQSSFVTLDTPAEQIDQGGTLPTPYNTLAKLLLNTFVLQESGITPTLPTGEIASNLQIGSRQGEVKLDTLGFSLTGLLLRASPTLYQGGELPKNELPGDGGHEIVDIKAAKVSTLLNPPAGTAGYTKTQLTAGITEGGSLEKYDNAGKFSEQGYVNVESNAASAKNKRIVQVLNTPVNYDDSAIMDQIDAIIKEGPSGQQSSTTKYAAYFKGDNKSKNSTVRELIDGDGQLNKNVAIGEALGTIGDDSQVQNNLIQLLTTEITPDRIKEYNRGFTNKKYNFYKEVSSYNQIVQSVSQAPTSDAKRPNYTISVSSVEGDSIVAFDAFIKTFSDSLNVSYGDFNHIGQQDTFKLFKGTTRQISLGFNATAMKGTTDFTNSDVKAKDMLKKINQLMLICGVGGIKGQYVTGPIVRVQVVGLVTGLICACSSIKVDVPIDNNTWDIDTELPQMYDISLDLAVLAMEGDQLLNKKGSFYNLV